MAAMSGERFEQMRADALDIFDSDTRIPGVGRHGDYLYNFWQDAAHPRGLWRRTTLEEYRKDSPEWDVVIDVDALAAAEDENWVGASGGINAPGFTHAVVALSRGGGDASVVREFDMITREFVADGFQLPEANCSMAVHRGWAMILLISDWSRGETTHEADSVLIADYEHTSSSSPERQNRGWCSIPTVKNFLQPECPQATDSSA
jgi:prolyl oligopeptidase